MKIRKRTIVLTIVGISVLYLLASIYLVFFRDLSNNFSLVQKWKEYYNVADWNNTYYAITDVDGDGKKDLITDFQCIYVSSANVDVLPENEQCEDSKNNTITSVISFGNKIKGSQKIVPKKPLLYKWLNHQYLVKTRENVWKYYDMNGLQIRVYKLGGNGLFVETSPSLLDRVDTLTYQTSHFLLALLLTALP